MKLKESPITAEKVRKGTCLDACLVDKNIGYVFQVDGGPHNMEGNSGDKAWGWGVVQNHECFLGFFFPATHSSYPLNSAFLFYISSVHSLNTLHTTKT